MDKAFELTQLIFQNNRFGYSNCDQWVFGFAMDQK